VLKDALSNTPMQRSAFTAPHMTCSRCERPLIGALDPREVSRASEVMGARAEGGEVSAVARGKDEAGEEMGEGQPV
jgi:hypothetical protein